MVRSRRLGALVVLLCLVTFIAPALTQAGTPRSGRLGTGLAALSQGEAPDRGLLTRGTNRDLQIGVTVELVADPGGVTRGRLRAAGLDLAGSWRRSIEGYVRPRDLERLAATPGVMTVRAIRLPITDAFVSPAPALHGATPWHQAQFSGNGVKVGILDGGFDGFSALLGSELPATVQALCFPELGMSSPNIADCVTPGETHGTAVAESIIDMAPAASLYVSNAGSPADLATAISWMTASGVRVINYSQSGGLQGMGDGLSQYFDSDYALVDLAVTRGALFVASAGNSGETSWMGPATDANANGWLDFAPGVEANNLQVSEGDEIKVAIRWASAASDYDLSIREGDTLLAESADAQTVTGDPMEYIAFTAPALGTYEISISHVGGPVAPTMRLMVHGSVTALTYGTTSGSLPTPADSRNPGMVTVGAVDYRTPTVIEPYSSQGPTLDGRTKPDLVAVDCAPTTVDPVFCGTSQAAPFVSGAAALLLEADPLLTPAALASFLKQRAIPTGGPTPNNVFGHGLLTLGSPPVPVPAAASLLAPPASGTAGSPLLGQPTVAVVDGEGRVTTTGPGATMSVTLSLASNPAGATFTCVGGNVRVAVAGIAAFNGCSVDSAGVGYTLRADVAGLTGATSSPFSVIAPGTASPISMTLTPTTVALGKAAAGTVTVGPLGVPSAPPELEWSTDGRVWTASGAVVLGAAGTGAFTHSSTTNRWLRARMAAADGTVDVTIAILLRVNGTAVLTSSIPTGRTILRTTRITLIETIRPIGASVARGRARFDLFLLVGTAWVRKRTLYANADPATGRSRLVTTLPTAGSWWIRSRAEPTATNGASAWTAGYRYLVR